MENIEITEKEDFLKQIGYRIRKCRKAKKLTQEQLENMTGIYSTHISRLERGLHNPHIDVIIKLAKALDVSVDTFFVDLSVNNVNIFLQNIKNDIEGMSQNQLSLIRDAILAIKKYTF